SERIDEFNLIDEASSSEYDEEIVSRFNDLFNIIHPDDSKSEKYNDDNDIGIIQSSEDMAPLPAADQRHPWLRYQIQEYTKGIRHSYEQRLEMIWSRPVNRVHILDFKGLTLDMRQDMAVRLRMVYSGEGQQLGGVRRRMTRRQFILALGLHTEQEMTEAGFGAYWAGSDRLIPDKGDLRDYWIEISFDRDFLGSAPSYVLIRDPVRRLCHMMIAYSISGRGQAPEKVTGVDLFYLRSMDSGTTNVPHLLAQYLFRHVEGRKSGARLSGRHFIRHLAMHFGLISSEGLRGLQVVTRELPLIDLHELGRLNICTRFGDTWASVTHEPMDQRGTPPPPPPAPQPRTMSQRIERIEEEVHDLQRDAVGLRGVVESFTTEQSRVSTWLITCMTQLMDASGQTYQPFENTLVGSSRLSFQRRVRPRTGDASTFATPHTDAQPDP
ncbi:hypothetical protein Tco_1427136, partial [Tanacetum coccineum]